MWIASIGKGESVMTIEKTCVSCGEIRSVHCTEPQCLAWLNGELIQKAMPDVPKQERELLISGLCGECWARTFTEEQD